MSLKHRIIKFFEEQDPIKEDYKTIRRASLFYSILALVCLLASFTILVFFNNTTYSLIALILYAVFSEKERMWDLAEVRKKLYELSGGEEVSGGRYADKR